MERKSAFLLMGFIFIIVGLILTIIGKNSVGTAKASLEWPTAQGQIVTSEMDMRREKSGGSTARHYQYRPNILYEYSVDGARYTSKKVAVVGMTSRDQKDIKPILRRYKEGSSVTVYYNPEDPKSAILEPGVTWRTYMPLGLGILFFMVGGGMGAAGLVASKT